MSCPFCASHDVEVVAPWAGQMITSQMRCRACHTYFEAIREEFAPIREEFEAIHEELEPSTSNSADDR